MTFSTASWLFLHFSLLINYRRSKVLQFMIMMIINLVGMQAKFVESWPFVSLHAQLKIESKLEDLRLYITLIIMKLSLGLCYMIRNCIGDSHHRLLPTQTSNFTPLKKLNWVKTVTTTNNDPSWYDDTFSCAHHAPETRDIHRMKWNHKEKFNVFHLPDFINNWRKDILLLRLSADLVLVPHSRL